MNAHAKPEVVAGEIEWTVTIHGQPLSEMAPATRDTLLKLMEAARAQAEAMLVGTAMPAPSTKMIDRMRSAVARWDERAKALALKDRLELSGVAETVDAREAFWRSDEAFEDAFNILIAQFEKEYPNG